MALVESESREAPAPAFVGCDADVAVQRIDVVAGDHGRRAGR